VVHVHIEIGRGLARAGVDERRAFDLEPFPLDDDTADELGQAGRGKRRLEHDVIAFHDGVRRVHQPVSEIAIGGEDHETLAIEVEPAGAKETEFRKLARVCARRR
jgi:hypothetical protein